MTDPNPIARSIAEAKAIGATKYFSGRPCKRQGHIAFRRLDGTCLECARGWSRRYASANRETMRARSNAWAKDNPERHNAKSAKFRRANPGRVKEIRKQCWEKHRDVRLAEKKAAYAANKEQRRAAGRAYHHANLERSRERCRQWPKTNPVKARALSMRRRARKMAAAGSHTPEDLIRIRGAQKDRCGCCHTNLNGKGHFDHIRALSRGGSNDARNLQLLCGACNSAKHDRDPIEFMQSRGRLL